MICVGSFKSLESLRDKPRLTGAPFEVRTWVGSDTRLISPFGDQVVTEFPSFGSNRLYLF